MKRLYRFFFSFHRHKIQSNRLHIYPILITTKTLKASGEVSNRLKTKTYPEPKRGGDGTWYREAQMTAISSPEAAQARPAAASWMYRLGTQPSCPREPPVTTGPSPGTPAFPAACPPHPRGAAALDRELPADRPPAHPDPPPPSRGRSGHSGQDTACRRGWGGGRRPPVITLCVCSTRTALGRRDAPGPGPAAGSASAPRRKRRGGPGLPRPVPR